MTNTKPRAFALMAASLVLAACGPAAEQQPAAPVEAASTPLANVGECVDTTVASTGPRLEGAPDSGSSIVYENGIAQVSYDVVPGIVHSQTGDAAHVCLVSVPENCPPGDDRGRVYSVTNARTGETWSAPDSQHMCGGA